MTAVTTEKACKSFIGSRVRRKLIHLLTGWESVNLILMLLNDLHKQKRKTISEKVAISELL